MNELIDRLIDLAFAEDIGDGDHTTLSCIPDTAMGKSKLLIKEAGVLAGIEIAKEIFHRFDSEMKVEVFINDGTEVKPGDVAMIVEGRVQSLLQTERLMLNVMQRMSGIATMTRRYVKQLEGTKTRVLDTRKTTPGMRMLEKAAVKIGGGVNHRIGLFDMILLKDNHVDFAGGIVVHASSGVAALAGAIFLGKRTEQNSTHVPANIPFVILGAAMLWLGWFGFNAGSSLAANGVAVKAFLNTNTASATAMMAWVVFDCLRGRKPSAMGAAIGAVVGLVAITPSAGFVTVGESIFIALVTTIVCNVAVYWKNHTSVDDALDVFPTHGVGGILGTVLTGVFVHGLIDGHWDVFFIHIHFLSGTTPM